MKISGAREKQLREWALFVIAVVGVAFAAFQWFVMRGQLEESRAEQRAWLSPKIIEAEGLSFQEDSAYLTLRIAIKNLGKLPARNVQTFIHLYPVATNSPQIYNETQRPKFCKGVGNFGDTGKIVFPDDQAIDFETVATTNPPEIKTAVPQTGNIEIVASGCVKYLSGSDHDPHFTGIYFVLMRSDPSTTWSFEFDPRAPPSYKLKVDDIGVGEYAN